MYAIAANDGKLVGGADQMRFAFVGHSFHSITASSKWFIELLAQNAETTIFWDHRWKGGRDVAVSEISSFDRIFVWQVEHVASELAKMSQEKVVFIPMWDSALHLRQDWWKSLGRMRVLSFSWTLHQRLRNWGVNSFHAQYFPNPADYTVVEDFETLRGFLWQRRPEIGWATVSKLSGMTKWDSFQLHFGIDPGFEEVEPPSAVACRRNNISFSRFSQEFDSSKAAIANVYFAPRMTEGIGMTFLEAMARGQCVVANDAPTMSEYITNRLNGILYDGNNIGSVDLRCAREFGAAARRTIEMGFADWESDLKTRIPDIIFPDGSGVLPARTRQQSTLRQPLQIVPRSKTHSAPKISIAIVTLNAAHVFEETLSSIIGQTFDDFEIVVVDGNSQDGTVDLIKENEHHLQRWVSETDRGPYDAMNKATRLCRGEYIMFMNAGDYFASRDALTRAFDGAPASADFIIGHHIYITRDGTEQLHCASQFDQTWQMLREGKLSWKWLSGVPGHQSTITRRSLLLSLGGYSPEFDIAADHEFMYRAKESGAQFHHCGQILSIYVGGGYSSRREKDCAQQWWKIARIYGERKRVDEFFRTHYPPSHEIGPLAFFEIMKYRIRAFRRATWIALRELNHRRLHWKRKWFGRKSALSA